MFVMLFTVCPKTETYHCNVYLLPNYSKQSEGMLKASVMKLELKTVLIITRL